MKPSQRLDVFLRGAEIKKCFTYIYNKVKARPSMIEEELYKVLDDSGLFKKLGYLGFGIDIKVQYPIAGERKKPDYACRDEYQNTIFVIEAKRPSNRGLKDALPQLWKRYVLPLKSKCGVLTNGRRIIIYQRVGVNHKLMIDVNLIEATENQCDLILHTLRKPQYNIRSYAGIRDFFTTAEKISLKDDLAKENFFETFKLKEDSIFGLLVYNLTNLFDEIYPDSRFLKGAYGFWRKTLARKPEKIPDTWKPFLKKDQDVFKFMFCLETAHTMLARLMIAKACEDLQFPDVGVSRFTLQKVHHFRDQIPLIAYPIVLIELIREMREVLVNSIFEEDIFSWWADAFAELSKKSSGELLREKPNVVLDDFGEVIAKLILVLYRFDFSEIAGDPLGDLYQQYFDRDTRKALGEFYTPVEVVDYILDGVDYKSGYFITNKRLLDPACGSGTFLVEALKRYIEEVRSLAKEKGWANILRELCNNPRMVGLDIHPFACLIAQVRFMLELVPYYKKALEEEKTIAYTLSRVPIFRTDSLLVEISPQEKMKEDITFTVTLPVKANAEKSVSVEVIIPSWEKASETRQINNRDEYFCAIQALFDAVKERVSAKTEEVHAGVLEAYLKNYLNDKDFKSLTNFFKPYGDRQLNEIKHLQSAFGDGRLVKSIEDAILAAVVKNYLQYDFVVGNPPYVRQEIIPLNYKSSVLKKDYNEVFDGRNDLYVYFIARGMNWLNQKGKLGYIVSNKFFKSKYGRKVREFIIASSCLNQLIDFGDTPIFRDATNYPSIFVLEIKTDPKHRISIVEAREKIILLEKPLEHVALNIGKESYADEYLRAFRINQALLSGEKWKLIPDSEMIVFHKIDKSAEKKLGDYCDIMAGMRTGLNVAFIVKGSEARKLGIEKELLRPCLRGQDVRKYSIHFDDLFVIYPNDLNLSDYPRAREYFNKWREQLESRAQYKSRNDMEWYEIEQPVSREIFTFDKIITPAISDENNFAFDDRGHYALDSCYLIVLKKSFTEFINLRYFLGLLNSKVLEFYIKQYSPFVQSKWYTYKAQYIQPLPIKLPRTDKEKRFASQIVQKVEKIMQLSAPEQLLKGFPDTYLSEYKSKSIEFDELKHVFNADHSKLKPFLSGTVVKGYAVYPAEGEDPILVETKEKARYLVLALRQKSVKQNDTVTIRVPRNNSIVEKIMRKFEKTIKEIEGTSVKQMEKEIDELVYQLYGLNNQDIKIVESFLEKF